MVKFREYEGFRFKMSRPELKQRFSIIKTVKHCDDYFNSISDEIVQIGKIVQYYNEAIHFLLSWEYVFIRSAIILGLISIFFVINSYFITSSIVFFISIVCFLMTQKIKRRIHHHQNSRILAEHFLNETKNGRM